MDENKLTRLAIETMDSLIGYYGNSDSRKVDCQRAKAALERIQIKPYIEDHICPHCNTYNEIWKKRENTVRLDVAYCWHCGQRVQLN